MKMIAQILVAALILFTIAPAALADPVEAYALADQPTRQSYVVDSAKAHNDGGGLVQVTRINVGIYRIVFQGLRNLPATSGGNVQVTADGFGSNYCKVENWGNDNVNVRCFNTAGQPADSAFRVLFLKALSGEQDLGYVWADQPTSADYRPSTSYSHNPGGGEIRVTRASTGSYSVRFSGWSGSTGGNAQVTAYSAGKERCQVASWGTANVNVRCFNPAGQPADTRFAALMVRPQATDPDLGFAWADRPSSSSYTPNSTYSHNGSGGAIRARRDAPGSYELELEGFASSSVASQVTAYNSPGVRCKTDGATSNAAGLTVKVKCFNAGGNPVDSRYSFQARAAAGDGGGSSVPGDPTVIDFEDLAQGTRVTTQYAARGVLFSGAYIDDDPQARSGGQVLRAANPGSEFHTGPMVIELTSGQLEVGMWAGALHSSAQGTLTAFNAAGQQIAQDGPKTVTNGGYSTRFQVTATTPSIRKVVLQYNGTHFESIDDLEIRGEAPGDLPTEAPVVTITQPQDFTERTGAQITLSGTVTGEEIVSPIFVDVEVARPAGSNAPTTTTFSVALNGNGTRRTFSQDLGISLGWQSLTVRAENSAGLTGSAVVNVRFLPQPIRDRLALEMQNGGVGSFLFGGSSADCRYVIHQRVAVTARGSETFVVRGDILDRWLTDQPSNGYPSLGCPTSEERQIEGDFATAQDFPRARLYADPNGVFKVPQVFALAIDAYGGETEIGIPMEDPSKYIPAIQIRTELFQRFRRPGRDAHEATLEIRTTHGQPPPRLYVERRAHYPESTMPGTFSATIVDEFPCANLGTCEVIFPDEPPVDDIGRFCNHEHFDWEGAKDALLGEITELDLDPPEWVAVEGDFVQTQLRGVVVKSGLSIEDNPFTHEYPEQCPAPGTDLWDCVQWMTGLGDSCCPSDWHIDIEPLPGWRGVLGVGSGSSDNYRNKVPVEYESRHGRHFHTGTRDPAKGQLMFVSGRWIVDCGHAYKTEIHPPSILSIMVTAPRSGKDATQASVWVNGFYSGDPVSFDIHPPPRPSPQANLVVVGPPPGTGGTDVTVTSSVVDSQFLQLNVSASPRQVEVTDAGEMKWQTGRSYEAVYWVHWDE